MKKSVKVWILSGVASSGVLVLLLGVGLFNFRNALIQQIWRQSEGTTDKKPSNAYEKFTVQGFQVLIDKDVMNQPGRTKPLLQRLDTVLLKIAKLTSPNQLAELKKTKIWVSLEKHRIVGQRAASAMAGDTSETIAVYRNSSAKELKNHGHNPDKAKGVEIFNADEFSGVSADLQLTIVLHELAHSYHDKVLGNHNAEVRSAYENAMTRGHYNVADGRSQTEGQAYAATNEHEYFAELSVAYLTKNDGFPQDRYVLAKYDPIGYSLMQKVWGPAR
jgi:hypothetical protein